MANKPICPACGSTDMILPAFTHFYWARGRWIEAKGCAEPADGAPLSCQNCGRAWQCSREPPFDDLVEDTPVILD